MRYWVISFFIHVAVFSFVWVGLSAPSGHGQNSFTYVAESFKEAHGSSQSNISSHEGLIFEDSASMPWSKMRELNKPQRTP
jgi:hypothetical protein